MLNLTGANTGSRRELDYYDTPPQATAALMLFLEKIIASGLLVWEPACGSGAMATVITSFGHRVYATDIRYTGFGTGGIDYLTRKEEYGKFSAIITNPPFFLSDRFIEKAIAEVPIVAMLLKSQFWHAKSRLKLFYDHPPTYVMPLSWRPDFMGGLRGGRPTMEVSWSVWLPGKTDTRYLPLEKPNYGTRRLF